MADNTIGKLIVQVLMNTEDYDKGTEKVKKKTSVLGDMLKKLADGIEKVFKKAATAISVAATATAAGAALIGSSFEQAISKVAAVKGIDKATEDFARLEAEARRLGASTNFTATEAAQGMEELARAGLSTDQIIAASQKTLEMAAGSQISLAESAAIVASSMAQFSIKAEDAGRITDVLTATTQNTLFGMEDLAVAMRYAGTVGASLGMTIEETSAAVAQFRNLGLEGSMAGTNFREAMSSIAKPTRQAEEALAKYGLTVRDVNPEFNTFRDIMIRVGKAGLSVGDAMTIFGLRTGANVKKIAEEMAKSSEGFDTLLSKLQDAAGTTATTYEIMTDNVRGAFDMMTSAMQEVLISLFGTFSGPLKDLLGSVTNLFVLVGEEIVRRTGTIGTSIEHTFGNFAAFIDQNAERWAKQIGNILVQASDFAHNLSTRIIPLLWEVLPLIDDIAIAMASFLAAHKVTLFVGFITGKLIPALVSTTWTLRGVATAMAAATGGMSALAAGVATLVAGLAIMIARLSSARRETERLQRAQENAAKGKESDDRFALKAARATLEEQQARAAALRAQLEAEGKLTEATRERLEWVQSLTAAEALRAYRAGEALVVEGEGYVRVSELLQGSEADRQRVLDHLDQLQTKLKRAQEIANRTTLSGGGLQAEADARARAALEAEQLERQIQGLRNALETYKPIQEDATDGANRFADALARFDRMAQMEAGELTEAQQEAQKAAIGLEDLIVQIRDSMADIGASESDAVQLALARELDAVRDMRDKALADERLNQEQRQKIIDDAELAIALIREKYRQQEAAREAEARDAEAQAARADAIRAEKQRQNEVTRLYEEALTARLSEAERLERHFQTEVLPLLAKYSGRVRAEIEAYWQAKIAEAREQEVEHTEGRFARLQRSVSAAWRGMGEAARAAMGVMREGLNAVVNVGQRVLNLIENVTGVSFRLGDAMAAVRDATADAAAEKGDALTERETEDVAKQAAAEFMAGLAKGAAQFARAMAAALPEIVTELVEAIPDIVDAFVEAMPRIVDALVDGLPKVIGAIADALPRIVDALVDALPRVVQAIVDALPEVVQAIVDALPKIVQALAEQIPVLITAIIDQLPILADALVGMVEQLVDALLAALPDIIRALLAAIPQIIVRLIEGVVYIVQAVIEALPDIIIALIEGIAEALPTIIVAVVKAIPKIILAIIRGIPNIITAIIRSIPQITIAVVQALPEIIAAIIGALPEIMVAMVMLVPELVASIVKAVPEIAVALWEGIIVEMGRKIGEIAKNIGEAFVEGVKKALAEVGEFFGNLFGGGKNKDKSKGSAYSGIPYVPATMRVTVHEGEAILPANRNPMRGGHEAGDPALAGARGRSRGRGGLPLPLNIILGGETVDRVLVDAYHAGKAPGISSLYRKAGAGVGVDPGRYNWWSK